MWFIYFITIMKSEAARVLQSISRHLAWNWASFARKICFSKIGSFEYIHIHRLVSWALHLMPDFLNKFIFDREHTHTHRRETFKSKQRRERKKSASLHLININLANEFDAKGHTTNGTQISNPLLFVCFSCFRLLRCVNFFIGFINMLYKN